MFPLYRKKWRSVGKKLFCKSVLSLALGLSAHTVLCVTCAEASQDLREDLGGFVSRFLAYKKGVSERGDALSLFALSISCDPCAGESPEKERALKSSPISRSDVQGLVPGEEGVVSFLQGCVLEDEAGSLLLKAITLPGKALDPVSEGSMSLLTARFSGFLNLGIVETKDAVHFAFFPIRGLFQPEALPFEMNVAASHAREADLSC